MAYLFSMGVLQMSVLGSALDKIRGIVIDKTTMEDARLDPKFFTRNRKMPFQSILMFLLRGVRTSTQSALNRFFRDDLDEGNVMSQQALSKARSHFDHSPFEKMFRSIVEMRYCGEHEIATLHGYQILAVDGSDIALPDMPAMLEAFGGTGRNADSPTAKASVLYDVLNDFLMDVTLDKAGTSERALAVGHMEILRTIAPSEKKLLIFDRGYPSAGLIEELSERGLHFLMRVRTKWNCDVDAISKKGQVVLANGYTVRVVKFKLSSGDEETLITDLFELPHEAFRELYFKRWPIETKYDVVKNKLALENFSGYTKNVVLQDFWVCMHLTNLVALAKIDADAEIQSTRTKKKNKYTYVANTNQVISSLREHMIRACFAKTEHERMRSLDLIEQEIRRSVVPIRPGRSVKRPTTPRKAKFHHNRKTVAGA